MPSTRLIPYEPAPDHTWAALERHLHDAHAIRYSLLGALDTAEMARFHGELHLTFRWPARARRHTHRDA